MARRGIEIDWVVVRVNTLRRVIALGATGLVAAALLAFGYSRLHLPPEAQARRAIQHAQRIHDAVAAKPVPRMWQTEFRQASQQLDESRSAYSREQWEALYEFLRNELRLGVQLIDPQPGLLPCRTGQHWG